MIFKYSKFTFFKRTPEKLSVSAETPTQFRKAVVESWDKNNPHKVLHKTREDVVYLPFRDIADRKTADTASYLLGLIRMKYGKEVAKNVYKSAFIGKHFYLSKLTEFFKRHKGYGFYYRTRTIVWNPKRTSNQYINPKTKEVEQINPLTVLRHGLIDTLRIKVTGWWLARKNAKNSHVVKTGRNIPNAISAFKGDKFMGTTDWATFGWIRKDFSPNTGLSKAQVQKSLKVQKDLDRITRLTTVKSCKLKIAKWFKSLPEDKWITLPKDKIGMMSMIYGRGCGKFLYRRHGNKILFVPIQHTKFTVQEKKNNYHKGGVIMLKKIPKTTQYTVGTWQIYSNYLDFFASEVKGAQRDSARTRKLQRDLATYRRRIKRHSKRRVK
jgi:hypothetical protein